ncbi:MAG: efflux RND transporter periplasmic adaptor subunit [Balneolaceae bacterium]|nr:MAG: efflux RND transporter periplasmic adaptor subunit [Balneolaceae bacterium]
MLNKGKKIILGMILMSSLIACNDEVQIDENNNNARLMPVETVTIVSDSFDDFIRLTGVVEALEDATISAETPGRILSIRERGDRVQRGNPIAQLDDRMIRAQFEAAKTGFELAEDTFNRLEALYADSIISTQDFRSARAQRDQASAQLTQAEKQLRDSRIEAPFSGRIEERMVRTGELVNPGQPVVRLVNTGRVKIVAGIPERYSGEITEGTDVLIYFRSLGGETRPGNVSYAGNVIDPDTRTFTVEVELQNPGEQIKPDMVVDLQVKRSSLEDAIIVPRTAILRDEEGVFIFRAKVQNGDKFAELIPIRTGLASGSLVQILDGLSEGDEIVVSGMRTLSAGDQLNILQNESSLERANRLREADRPVITF